MNSAHVCLLIVRFYLLGGDAAKILKTEISLLSCNFFSPHLSQPCNIFDDFIHKCKELLLCNAHHPAKNKEKSLQIVFTSNCYQQHQQCCAVQIQMAKMGSLSCFFVCCLTSQQHAGVSRMDLLRQVYVLLY